MTRPSDPATPTATVLWRGGELPLMELATLWSSEEGHALRGWVVGALGGAPLSVEYEVSCTGRWETRSARVRVTTPPETREVDVRFDPDSGWSVNGAPRPDLNDAVDVDVQVTPSTNTLPIRRLGLPVGGSAGVVAAWILMPDLEVARLEQTYERMGPREYRYRSGDFRADLVVDEHGLVERYGSFWQAFLTR